MQIRFISATLILLILFAMGGCNSNQMGKLEKENITLSDKIDLLTGQVETLMSENKKLTTEINDLKSKVSVDRKITENLEAINNEIEKEIEKERERLEQFVISFDDQKHVEKLIQDYFSYLENKDYSSAWELTSVERKDTYSKEKAIEEHWYIDSIHLTSLKGYLPPAISETWVVPNGTPTIWYMVNLDIEPSPNSAWEIGLNERFVTVVKESDGKWKINGLTTSP